ncbi:MAG: SRPBCC domain-containing protein [Solirubrobacterales bacterium]
MHTTRRSRTVGFSAEELWPVVSDPHHLPRWWPRVERVESVEGGAFTEVLKTAKGKLVRADFTVVELDASARRLTWSQQIEDSPFARLLESAETGVQLNPEGSRTEVTIELRQELARGRVGSWFHPRLGSHLVQRAAAATLEEALDGLERIGAPSPGTYPSSSPGSGRDPGRG